MIRMKRTWSVALAGTAALMTSAISLADTTATVTPSDASNASVANVKQPSMAKKILDRTSVTFFTQWYGSSPGKLTDPVQPNEYGRTKEAGGDPQEFDNTLSMTYKLDDKGLVAGLAINEVYYIYGKGHTFVDPYLKVAKNNLVKNGNFTFGGDFRTYLPVSNLSHNNHRTTRLRSFSTANYDIPNTKFSLQSFNDINFYVYGDGADPKAKNFLLAVQPTVNYQAWHTLGFFVGYELDTKHTREKDFFDLTAADTYLYLGTAWDITPKMNFSPLLSLRPGGAVNADSTQIQATFSYKLL